MSADFQKNDGSCMLTGRYTGKTGRTKRSIRLLSLGKGSVGCYIKYLSYRGAKVYMLGSSITSVVTGMGSTRIVICTAPVCCCRVYNRVGALLSELGPLCSASCSFESVCVVTATTRGSRDAFRGTCGNLRN